MRSHPSAKPFWLTSPHREARDHGDREGAVHQRLAPLSALGVLVVEMDLVVVVRQQREPDVVSLGDRPADGRPVHVADLEVLQEPPLPAAFDVHIASLLVVAAARRRRREFRHSVPRYGNLGAGRGSRVKRGNHEGEHGNAAWERRECTRTSGNGPECRRWFTRGFHGFTSGAGDSFFSSESFRVIVRHLLVDRADGSGRQAGAQCVNVRGGSVERKGANVAAGWTCRAFAQLCVTSAVLPRPPARYLGVGDAPTPPAEGSALCTPVGGVGERPTRVAQGLGGG